MRDLSSQPGIEPTPPALEGWSLNHWTAREVSEFLILMCVFCFLFVFFLAEVTKDMVDTRH